ncbi:MAG: aromatic ring-hydroxylating dioxygenase subunit alpha [Hyphomonadaceae bacterium]|nr:aromatic ring-hydroxylating dioxygenase subunit alpha [Hyphomonadaceae bacterium]
MGFGEPPLCEGWHWAAASCDLKRGAVRAIEVGGRKLALYRGEDGVARCVDAFCPHMGAHLALGKVEGAGLRCFFHGWRFGADGKCDEIPALDTRVRDVCLKKHAVSEQDGLVWLWVGDGAPTFAPPIHHTLVGKPRRAFRVARWKKKCHPHVVLVNAIDEQHFRTVHQVPGEALKLRTESIAPHHFRVENTGAPPETSWLWRFLRKLYRGETLTYEIDYFSAATGCIRLGPSWARLHLMFAVRPTPDGGAEGMTIALSERRRGIKGAIIDYALMGVAALAGAYFAVGDTKVFDTISFELKTPIPADRTVWTYVRHVEAQQRAHFWLDEHGLPRQLERFPRGWAAE